MIRILRAQPLRSSARLAAVSRPCQLKTMRTLQTVYWRHFQSEAAAKKNKPGRRARAKTEEDPKEPSGIATSAKDESTEAPHRPAISEEWPENVTPVVSLLEGKGDYDVEGEKIMFQFYVPGRVRTIAAIFGVQGLCGLSCCAMSVFDPGFGIPWYWGTFGGLAFSAMLTPLAFFHAQRTVAELALTKNRRQVRITSYDVLGRLKSDVVPVAEVGKGNVKPLDVRAKGAYWPFKVGERNGFYLLDKKGRICDHRSLFNTIGYSWTYSENKSES